MKRARVAIGLCLVMALVTCASGGGITHPYLCMQCATFVERDLYLLDHLVVSDAFRAKGWQQQFQRKPWYASVFGRIAPRDMEDWLRRLARGYVITLVAVQARDQKIGVFPDDLKLVVQGVQYDPEMLPDTQLFITPWEAFRGDKALEDLRIWEQVSLRATNLELGNRTAGFVIYRRPPSWPVDCRFSFSPLFMDERATWEYTAADVKADKLVLPPSASPAPAEPAK